jgi:hypothetical protein
VSTHASTPSRAPLHPASLAELREVIESAVQPAPVSAGSEPPGLLERIVAFLRHSDISVAEVICAAETAIVVRWLAVSPAEALARSEPYRALVASLPHWAWLGAAAFVLSVAAAAFVLHYTMRRTARALRIAASLLHVGLYTLLAWQITAEAPAVVLAGQLFWVLAGAAFWSTLRLAARLRT